MPNDLPIIGLVLDSWAPLCYPLNKKINWVREDFIYYPPIHRDSVIFEKHA